MPPAMSLHSLASPARFQRFSRRILLPVASLATLLLVAGLYLALFVAPPDYQQGETVRIMFVHVPAAWMALMAYVVLAACGASLLIWRHPLADIAARATAPIGAGLTVICLATGSLWGKPTWGTWWVWDARLTSMLVLLFLYVGHIALANAFDDRERGSRAAAILALAGVVNLPVIKFSLDWWYTLHQPAGFASSSALRPHGEEDAGRVEALLSTALRRRDWLLGHVLVTVVGTVFVAVLLLRIDAGLTARKLEALAHADRGT